MLLWTSECMYLFKLVSSPKPRSGLAGSYGNSSFSFLRKLQIIFHQLDLSFMSQDDMVYVLHAQHWFNAPGLHEDCGFHVVAGTSSPAAPSPLQVVCAPLQWPTPSVVSYFRSGATKSGTWHPRNHPEPCKLARVRRYHSWSLDTIWTT